MNLNARVDVNYARVIVNCEKIILQPNKYDTISNFYPVLTFGIEVCMTSSTFGISRPRAATSVVNKTL